MKKEQIYVTFSLVATSALLTTHAKKEIKYKKFTKRIKAQIKETKKVLILGDSVARGYGTEIGGIAQSLQEKLNIHFDKLAIENLGIDGLTSVGLLEKIKSEEWHSKIEGADLIIINIGGNDLLQVWKSEGPKGIMKNYQRIRRQFSRNIKEIVKTINEKNENTLIFMNELYDSMDKKNSYYGLSRLVIGYWNKASNMENIVKVKTKEMRYDKGYWIDMVHPNEDGYEEMGALVFNQINKFL